MGAKTEGTFASLKSADLSVRGMRERAQQREAELFAGRLEARALRAFKRAARARINSNERRKMIAKGQVLGALVAGVREDPGSVTRGYLKHPENDGKILITGDLSATTSRGSFVHLGRGL